MPICKIGLWKPSRNKLVRFKSGPNNWTTQFKTLERKNDKSNRPDLKFDDFYFLRIFFKFGLKFEKMFLADFFSQHRLLQGRFHRHRSDFRAIYKKPTGNRNQKKFEEKKSSKSTIFEIWLCWPSFPNLIVGYSMCFLVLNLIVEFEQVWSSIASTSGSRTGNKSTFSTFVLEKKFFS